MMHENLVHLSHVRGIMDYETLCSLGHNEQWSQTHGAMDSEKQVMEVV